MNINVFKLCSSLKVLGYLMILLVAGIIGVSYYAVVIITLGPQLLRGGGHSVLAFSIVTLFHILLVMLLWSYFRVVFKDPGSVPENWRQLNLEGASTSSCIHDSDYGAPEISGSGSVDESDRGPISGYCNHCQNGKPPRCHHCSVKDVFLRWIIIVFGWSIALELLYTFLETTMDTLVLLPSFIKFFNEAKDHSTSPSKLAVIFWLLIVYLDAVLNLAFALSLLCFIVMHASLLSSNTTSIEVYEKKGAVRWKYDLGRKKNFEQVFGEKKAFWFLPMFSKDDLDDIPALHGLDFPTRSEVEA